MLHRVIVMGSRDFNDSDFLRKQMLDSYKAIVSKDSDALVQFVMPSEVGYNRIELPVRGVARSAYQILRDARERGVRNPHMLLPILATIDWAQVQTVESHHRHFHHEVIDSRKVPANFLWNSDVLDAGTWGEFIVSQGGVVDPKFTAVAEEVIVVEHNGADGWCRDMMRKAQDAGLAVRHFMTRDFVPGVAR